ncbi:Clp protease N-terminal domain-containing protein [Pseudarthrobacter sulfonivorans]|uniref:Clp protease N-terminal domain-containing protein n=1 Tax=Pseudarthrobacter sulfonivorans TaxID=121292 RepID=UPI0027889BC7|nr:P-loop NTPase fold protein [Pseudarthrobacter sulfonivorans]MDQ0000114.1 hypothetical protein [Pseudarthrobacter sulfonivorans]
MFERFTDRARRVVVLAQEEARMLNHNYIGTEHILLGLIHEGEGVAAKALESLSISLDGVREQVQEIWAQGQQATSGEKAQQVNSQGQHAPAGHMPFTPRAKKVLELSLREALQLGHNYIGTEHILLGLIREGQGVAAQVLVKLGADLNRVRQQVIQLLSGYQGDGTAGADTGPGMLEGTHAGSATLDRFCSNLTQAARDNKLYPAIGRETEIGRVIQVLSRRTKNNPILIGEPGVNKTAVAEGLAQAIVRGDVTRSIQDRELYALDLSALTTPGATFEDNLSAVLKEIETRYDIILFIDEIQILLNVKAPGLVIDVMSRVTTLLRNGNAKIIGATTSDDYRSIIEPNMPLQQFIDQINVDELSVSATVEHLKTVWDRLEAHYRVTITSDALAAAALLAHRYLQNKFLPDSAIALLDEAAGAVSVRRLNRPPELRAVDERIAKVRIEKESAIDAQDFEGAAALRDQEQQMNTERAEIERRWKSGDLDDIHEVDEDMIIEVVATLANVDAAQIADTLRPRIDQQPKVQEEAADSYALLGDQPVKDTNYDLLGTAKSAASIASIISHSRSSSPFVLAVDGGWGMGKSTLLGHIASNLSQVAGVEIVHFNAWTSQGENALEGLIKSVLIKLDPSSLRRGLRRIAKHGRMMLFVRILLGVVARFAGVSRIVDQIWNELEIDAKGRNELRTAIFDMLSEWTQKEDTGAIGRHLIIFIDDLDRCSDRVIVQICEAVKLYLDAPGLIFVIGCDLSVLRRGVSASDRGNEATVYLEKIIQVVHRLQPAKEEQIRSLIHGYAHRSGTEALIDATVEEILSKRTGRNPRRIKRVINSFVLESHLNPAWTSPEVGNAQLIKAVIIQHLYPSFYEVLIDERSGLDPIGDFLDYAEVKGRAADPPPTNDRWWSTNSKLFRRHDIAPPSRSTTEREGLMAALSTLESVLPSEYPPLARDVDFISLLHGVGDRDARMALRSLLMNEPLGTETFTAVWQGPDMSRG